MNHLKENWELYIIGMQSFIISILFFIINIPESFIYLYFLTWKIIGIHFFTSFFYLIFLTYLIIIFRKKLDKNNFYKNLLFLILILSIALFSIFLLKIIGLSDKYLFFVDFIIIDADNNILTGIGIGISALLAVFSMLYQIENTNLEKIKDKNDTDKLKIETLKNIITKIINIINFEINLLNKKKPKINLTVKKGSMNTYLIIIKDFNELIKYYEYISDFNNLNSSEQSIKVFESELNGNETNISMLIDSLRNTKEKLENLLTSDIRQ